MARSARAACLLGLGGVLLGCVPGIPVLPAPSSVVSEATELGGVERLGRWNGERFVEVTPGSVPPSYVHVIVHGWAPGWGEEVAADPGLRSWEAVDGAGRRFEPWIADLARVISANDPHAVVLAYSWIDDAATGRAMYAQRDAWAHTDLHGRVLADALTASFCEGFTEQDGATQLIGHSYGARVATVAAVELDKAPRQLTIFDSPDAPMTYLTGARNQLAELLQKLPIGSDEGQVFVDNYVSMVGSRYRSIGTEGVVDVALAPPYGALAYRSRHLYPMRFYASTATHAFGMGWSPFFEGRPPRPGCYEQPYGEIELNRGCSGLP